jgi:hypothetical protein
LNPKVLLFSAVNRFEKAIKGVENIANSLFSLEISFFRWF